MKAKLHILLAEPRGFCAGVDRAIQIVERSLAQFGRPVYVRHEIVHNRYVVEELEERGAIFVDELDEVPDGVPVIFSAHGVPKSVPAAAIERGLKFLDATCPLVSKVHLEAERQYRQGHQIILIGHAGHPEVVGTMGQLPDDAILLVESMEDALAVAPADPNNLAYITQTTLSVDDTAEIVACLKRRFPSISGPKKEDICYATTNRQEAVKKIAARCDFMFVIGAQNSSNSLRLVEVAARNGTPHASLLEDASAIPLDLIREARTIGITAGASAPEILIEQVIEKLRDSFDVTVETVRVRDEDISFKLPRELVS